MPINKIQSEGQGGKPSKPDFKFYEQTVMQVLERNRTQYLNQVAKSLKNNG